MQCVVVKDIVVVYLLLCFSFSVHGYSNRKVKFIKYLVVVFLMEVPPYIL